MVRSVTAVRTLLLTDFVDSTRLLESLGDQKGAQLFARNDQIARALLSDHSGTEIDKTDGFLFLFQRPIDATRFALAYHQALKELSSTYGVDLTARAAIHVGEVVERRNAQEDIERGAKPVEVEGLAKPLVARLMGLGMGGQTLMTKFAFDIAKRAVVGDEGFPKNAQWMSHGWFKVKGIDDPIMVCEVGVPGTAPLCPPPDSEKAWKAKDEPTGWGPRHWMLSVGVVGILLMFAVLWQGQSDSMVTPDEAMPVVA